jgi:hypothetical protein
MKTECPVRPVAVNKKIFFFGFGYTASWLAPVLEKCGWAISGTTTDEGKRDYLRAKGYDINLFDLDHPILDPQEIFDGVTHIIMSIPPGDAGDIAFNLHGEDIAAIPTLEWAGYLSTTGVYGNQDGAWVDESAPPNPDSRRGSLRLKAEQQWQSLYLQAGLPLHIFRLSGIYGPGRSAIDSVRTGQARRIEKPGHVFNRIHVADIVQTLVTSFNQPNPGAIYNLSDDLPSPAHEVIAYACSLAGVMPPPIISFDQAELAPMVRSFYKDNKRVSNSRIKNELGVHLAYPDYKRGLPSCLDVCDDTQKFLMFENRGQNSA